MSKFYFVFIFDFSDYEWLNNKSEEDTMCKKLQELSKYKVEDLYDLFEEEFSNPPINIHRILDKLDVKYSALDFNTLDVTVNDINLPEQADMVMGAVGAYSEKDFGEDFVEITVNSNDNYHRQRFTLAHELAHCMLHSDRLKDGRLELRTSLTTDEPHEREANILAGEILIPRKLLKLVCASLPIPLLPLLAEKFDVSENVMEARLKHLNMGYYTL